MSDTDTEVHEPTDQEIWEAHQNELRRQQGLGPDQVPEQRPQAFAQGETVIGEVEKKLRDAGSNMASNAPAHGYEEHERANSPTQARKAARQSMGPEIMYPGSTCYINNPDDEGSEHHGRAVAVNRITEYESPEDEALANSGYNADRRFARVKTYEVSTRDGRAETLFVSANHLTKVDISEFHRSAT